MLIASPICTVHLSAASLFMAPTLCMTIAGPIKMVCALTEDAREYPTEWLKMWVPALIYTVQMNLLYIGYGNVQAAIGQITYQSKVLFTALLSVWLLKRKQSHNQWIAVFVLIAGESSSAAKSRPWRPQTAESVKCLRNLCCTHNTSLQQASTRGLPADRRCGMPQVSSWFKVLIGTQSRPQERQAKVRSSGWWLCSSRQCARLSPRCTLR